MVSHMPNYDIYLVASLNIGQNPVKKKSKNRVEFKGLKQFLKSRFVFAVCCCY